MKEENFVQDEFFLFYWLGVYWAYMPHEGPREATNAEQVDDD